MTGCLVGADETELLERAGRLAERFPRGEDGEAVLRRYRERAVAGTTEEVVERLSAFADAGVERVMLQHLLHDDLDAVALIGRELVPALASADATARAR